MAANIFVPDVPAPYNTASMALVLEMYPLGGIKDQYAIPKVVIYFYCQVDEGLRTFSLCTLHLFTSREYGRIISVTLLMVDPRSV